MNDAQPQTQFTTVDGLRMEYTLSGSGSPIIVLLNGHRAPLAGWMRLYPQVGALGTVIAYNRLSVGGSDGAQTPQHGRAITSTLNNLLQTLGLAPPYVLVGYSLGGLYANLYARLYPERTAGVVLLESGHPDEAAEREAQLGPVGRALQRFANPFGAKFKRDANSEFNGVPATVTQIRGAGPFPNVPLTVVTGTHKMWLLPASAFDQHQQKQKELAKLVDGAQHILAVRSGHAPQITEPSVVIDAIQTTVQRIHVGGHGKT